MKPTQFQVFLIPFLFISAANPCSHCNSVTSIEVVAEKYFESKFASKIRRFTKHKGQIRQCDTYKYKIVSNSKFNPKRGLLKKDKIGGVALGLLILAFLIGFWGSLFLASMLAFELVLALLSTSLLLSLIGTMINSENNHLSKTVLYIFAIIGVLSALGFLIALLILRGRE